MGKYDNQGNLNLTSTQKIIQGGVDVLDAARKAKLASIQLDTGVEITEIISDTTGVVYTDVQLLTAKAVGTLITAGSSGTSGTSGIAGTSGSSGSSGASGSSGISGSSGTSGSSGSSGTSGVLSDPGTIGSLTVTTRLTIPTSAPVSPAAGDIWIE